MDLYFIRHSETDWNRKRRIQGMSDIPLNEFGRHLARETAKEIRDIAFDVCFSSPLCRATETAKLVLDNPGIPIIKDARLAEMKFGSLEGCCCSKTNWEVPDEFRAYFDDPANYIPGQGGESFAEVVDRASDFLNDLLLNSEYRDSSILVCTHGAFLAAMMCVIKNAPISKIWENGVAKNCAITYVRAEGDGTNPEIIWENRAFYKEEVEAWK